LTVRREILMTVERMTRSSTRELRMSEVIWCKAYIRPVADIKWVTLVSNNIVASFACSLNCDDTTSN